MAGDVEVVDSGVRTAVAYSMVDPSVAAGRVAVERSAAVLFGAR